MDVVIYAVPTKQALEQKFVSPPGTTLDLDADHDNEMSLRFRTLDYVLESMEIPGLTEWEFVVDEELLIIIGDYESTNSRRLETIPIGARRR